MMQNDTHNTPTPFVADGYQTVEDTLNILHREDLLQAELDNDGQDVWGDQVPQPQPDSPGDPHSLHAAPSTQLSNTSAGWDAVLPKDDHGPPPALGECRPDSIFRRVAVRLVPVFFAIALLCQLDRTNLSFAALQLTEDLHWSKSVYGLGSGLFFIGYAVFQLPSNLLCMLIGAPRWLAVIVTVWGTVACLFATLRSKVQFYILRLLLGMAEAGAYPAMYHHMLHFFNDQEVGVAYTFTSSATAVAGLIGGPIAAACLCMDGVGGLAGWQWLFLLEGLPTIVFGLCIPWLLLKNIACAYFLTPDERCWLLQRQQRALRKKLQRSARANKAHAAFLEWRVYWLSAAWFFMASSMDALVFWIPQIIKASLSGSLNTTEDTPEDQAADRCGLFAAGDGAAKVAMLATVPYTTAAVCMILVSMSSKHFQERHLHAAGSMLMGAVMLGILPLALQSVGFAGGYAMLIITCAGVWGAHGPLLSWPSQFLDGPAASTGFAIIKTIGALGSFSGSYLVGLVTENASNDFGPALWMLAGQLGACALLLALFPEPIAGEVGCVSAPWWMGALCRRVTSGWEWVRARLTSRGGRLSGGEVSMVIKQPLASDDHAQQCEMVVPHA